MNEALRKGWCPGALRPMMARDGLIVRLRITGGILPAATAHALADLATRHGNGLLDLTARGNLQMRGIAALPDRHRSPPAVLRSAGQDPGLLDSLAALGLLDADAAAESVRNVIASPLAGRHGGLDIRALTRALEQALARDDALHALPGKFGFLIDDGSLPSLADVPADVRFDWGGGAFAIGLGGTAAAAVPIGTCTPADLVTRATAIARAAIDLFSAREGTRRMRDLVAIHGGAAIARACGETRPPPRSVIPRPQSVVGPRTFDDLPVLGLAAPFGRLDAAMLRAAADLAAGELRLTPWRTLLLPGVRQVAGDLASGFITDPADPRLAVAACVGAVGCDRGSTDTHADATALAPVAPRCATGPSLHISGCEKGCAKPSASPVTLVARAGRYDLVRDGRPGDMPHMRGLDLDQARAALADVLAPA